MRFEALFYFLQPKAIVLLAAGAIAPHLGEFPAEHQIQLRAVDPQQVNYISAAGLPARITVKAELVRRALPLITVVWSITRNLWCIKSLPLLPSVLSSIS